MLRRVNDDGLTIVAVLRKYAEAAGRAFENTGLAHHEGAAKAYRHALEIVSERMDRAEQSVNVDFDTDNKKLSAALEELVTHSNLNLEVDGVRDLIQGFFDGIENLHELYTVKRSKAERAPALLVFEPCERLFDLLVAVRARVAMTLLSLSVLRTMVTPQPGQIMSL